MRDRDYGALLGAIKEAQASPAPEDAFFIGKSAEVIAKRSGKLYFTVNDVWDRDDASFPNKFFIDNFGFFHARVKVSQK
jgi:hypothetical protein